MPSHVNVDYSEKERVRISFDIALDAANLTVEEVRKQVAATVVEELSKSPEFAKVVRELALAKINEIVNEYVTRGVQGNAL